MKFHQKISVICSGFMLLISAVASAQQPQVVTGAYTQLDPINLYEDPTGPGWKDWPGNLGIAEEVYLGGAARAVYNVSVPTLTPYLPDESINTKTAVVIAPGGGWRLLAMGHEGYEVAEWFAERGIAAFVLKYRLVQLKSLKDFGSSRDSLPVKEAASLSITDGERALAMVRRQAQQYNVDPGKIGIVGFSAGAYAAATIGMMQEAKGRPDFVGLIYGAPTDLSKKIPAPNTKNALPPFFMASAINDSTVGVDRIIDLTQKLFKAGYTPELHLFKDGSHGFGMTRQGTSSDLWINDFYWWMKTQNLAQKPGEPAHKITMMPGPDLSGE